MPEIAEKYQIAGLDERERGFNRLAEVERSEGRYRALWHYEKAEVMTSPHETATDALDELIGLLQARGYTQLRTRVCFRGDSYLGTQEMWIEHEDPAADQGFLRKMLDRLRQSFSKTGPVERYDSKD